MASLSASGAYLLSGHDGAYAVERFACASTPAGWQYDATREDPVSGAPLGRLELQLSGGTVRLHVEAGGWVLRGAAAGGEVLWRRGDEERSRAGDGFAGSSPAYLVVAARLGRARLRLVEVTEPVLATRAAQRSWVHVGEAEHDGTPVQSFAVDDLATGERGQVHLAEGVVVAAPGVRLQSLTLS